jgi:hypothetical protein
MSANPDLVQSKNIKSNFVNNIFIQDTIDGKLAQNAIGMEINSPPVEPTNPLIKNNPRLKYLNTVITDDMIKQYQKLDNLLNLAIERVSLEYIPPFYTYFYTNRAFSSLISSIFNSNLL